MQQAHMQQAHMQQAHMQQAHMQQQSTPCSAALILLTCTNTPPCALQGNCGLSQFWGYATALTGTMDAAALAATLSLVALK